MTPPENNQPTSAPSIFLSYASEDRPAVRLLRDALSAAGLDVWYDENELTGGDAWDRKIRRQIRECTYFMPIISATTNARAEGYFRREWRMGVERTQDMADDVIYLLPVTIDDVDESTARVPEQFLNVQWLRAPGGQLTPALNDLCRRLLSGGSHQMHKPASTATRATTARSAPPPLAAAAAAADKHNAKEDEDLAPPAGKEWWFWLRRVWRKMPRWVRFCLWGVFVLSALNTCVRCSRDDEPTRERKAAAVVNALANSQTDGKFDPATVKKSVQDALKAAAEARANNRKPATPPDLDYLSLTGGSSAKEVDKALYGQLISAHEFKVHLSALPLKGTPGDSTPVDRAKFVGARLVLSGGLTKQDDGKEIIRVTLQRVSDGETLWTADYAGDNAPVVISAQIYGAVLPLILKKE
jgi:hypothetical protein